MQSANVYTICKVVFPTYGKPFVEFISDAKNSKQALVEMTENCPNEGEILVLLGHTAGPMIVVEDKLGPIQPASNLAKVLEDWQAQQQPVAC